MKTRLRNEMTENRKSMTNEAYLSKSEAICKIILESSLYTNANHVFSFVSMGKEVNTYPLLERALADGKEVCVPIAKKNEGMFFVPIKSLDDLEKSTFGVMEPKKGREEAVAPVAGDVFLVPGLVFDKMGNRYGYGGGFYDRYLQEYSEVERWAIAFSFQVIEERLDVETFDIPVHKIVTEKGILEVMR